MIGDSDRNKHFDPYQAEKEARRIKDVQCRKYIRADQKRANLNRDPNRIAIVGAKARWPAPVTLAPINFAKDAK